MPSGKPTRFLQPTGEPMAWLRADPPGQAAAPERLALSQPATSRAPWRSQLRQSLVGVALVLPGFAAIALFTLYPLVSLLWLSLHRQNLAHPQPRWAGLANFAALAHDPLFWQVLRNSLCFVALTTPAAVALGLVFAWWMEHARPVQALVRFCFLHPIVLPPVSVASVWLFLLTPDYGLVSRVVQWLGGPASLALLRDARTALLATALVHLWRQAGFAAIFWLAGLHALDPALTEAARLDGAGRWALLRHVWLPQLWPIGVFVSAQATLSALQAFDMVYVMTQGGPNNATNLFLFHIYETQFTFGDVGQAAALSVVFLLLVLAVTLAHVVGLDRRGAMT